jgi:hypothetical protein
VKLKSVLLVAAAVALGSVILPMLLGLVLGFSSVARGPAPQMTIRYVDAPTPSSR